LCTFSELTDDFLNKTKFVIQFYKIQFSCSFLSVSKIYIWKFWKLKRHLRFFQLSPRFFGGLLSFNLAVAELNIYFQNIHEQITWPLVIITTPFSYISYCTRSTLGSSHASRVFLWTGSLGLWSSSYIVINWGVMLV
jgi:hypothetical protein